MFLRFLDALRAAGIPAGLKEHLLLLEALDAEVIERTPEQFYYLSRAVYGKDEGLLDGSTSVRQVFSRPDRPAAEQRADIPADWLKAVMEKFLTPEERAAIESLGSWDAIMEALRERLAEQHGRHEGGNKWIGTGGHHPFGNGGYNPRASGSAARAGTAARSRSGTSGPFATWTMVAKLGTRNIKVALRRLRRFAREGAASELDIDGTIDGTARQGWLDVRMRPERRNAVKLLLFLDVGGSMDPFVTLCEELFSAATAEFKNLEFFYFHNCPYEACGRTTDVASRNARRPGTCCTAMAMTISASSSATRR